MAKAPLWATTECAGCGKPIVWITTLDGKRVCLDPRAPIFTSERDGEGGSIWYQDKSQTTMVSHFATCSHANDFSGSKKKAT